MVRGIGDRRHDAFVADIASYVLGALPRRRLLLIEGHLARCPACRAEAESLAGVQALLGRVVQEPDLGPLPGRSCDVAALAWALNRRRRRRRRLIVASAALSVVIASVLAWVGTRPGEDEDRAPMLALELAPAWASVIRGSVAVEDVAWGTRLTLSCIYGGSTVDADSPGEAGAYALWVRTSEGRTEEVATWWLAPGRAVVVEASTSLRAAEIAAIEMGPRGGPATHRTTMD